MRRKDLDKNIKAKKTPYSSLTNVSYNSKQIKQSIQASAQVNKKDFGLYHDSNRCQSGNTLMTRLI